MANNIGWCDRTWNPITGCTPISEGCTHCWAKQFSKRLAGRYGYDKESPFKITYHWNHAHDPVCWKGPQRVFVCSMGDLFHEDIPYYTTLSMVGDGRMTIASVVFAMAQCNKHTFYLLTKRPGNMLLFFQWYLAQNTMPSNVWLGISVENQKRADERIPILLQIPAAKRFVSVEPMLGPVALRPYLEKRYRQESGYRRFPNDPPINYLDWVIAGPETGPKARPCKKEWVEALYEQCQEAGVPFWDKTDILGKNIKERPHG